MTVALSSLHAAMTRREPRTSINGHVTPKRAFNDIADVSREGSTACDDSPVQKKKVRWEGTMDNSESSEERDTISEKVGLFVSNYKRHVDFFKFIFRFVWQYFANSK